MQDPQTKLKQIAQILITLIISSIYKFLFFV